MASNRLGFKQFLNKVKSEKTLNVIVDSNILIANSDELHSNHEQVRTFLESLYDATEVSLYTTVTTKAEFLDYQRRRFLTEGLFDLVGKYAKHGEITPNAKKVITQMKLRRGKRISDEEKRTAKTNDTFNVSVNYLRDSEIKEIKKSFRARDIDKELGWLKICQLFLSTKVAEQEEALDSLCYYLSAHNNEQASLFNNRNIDWKKATHLSSVTGMGYSDALVLNMFTATNMKYLLTLDFDLIYAVSISAKDKFVVLPDSRLSGFKQTLKKI